MHRGVTREMQVIRELRYAVFLIVHPFRGFWELKHEKRGSLKSMTVLLALYILCQVLSRQLTAYLFNYNDVLDLNILLVVAQNVITFLLFCVSNWCLTTLFDGEGSFRDICIFTAYALTPMILIEYPMILVSHALALRESAFYTFFLALGMAWTGLLLITGTMVTHQYEFGKTLLIMLFILLGMGLMLFIGLLFFNLIGQMSGFAVNIYKELIFRV